MYIEEHQITIHKNESNLLDLIQTFEISNNEYESECVDTRYEFYHK